MELLLARASRIHVMPEPADTATIAGFLVSALLLSHNIRRGVLAVAPTRTGLLVAPGWSLRQLRPDMETATGWVRAVLYRGKARGLGAALLELTLDEMLEDARAEGYRILSTCPGKPRLGETPPPGRVVIVHAYSPGEHCWLRSPCGAPCRAALANIALDRLRYPT